MYEYSYPGSIGWRPQGLHFIVQKIVLGRTVSPFSLSGIDTRHDKRTSKLAKNHEKKGKIPRLYVLHKMSTSEALFQKIDWAHACTNVSTDDDIP